MERLAAGSHSVYVLSEGKDTKQFSSSYPRIRWYYSCESSTMDGTIRWPRHRNYDETEQRWHYYKAKCFAARPLPVNLTPAHSNVYVSSVWWHHLLNIDKVQLCYKHLYHFLAQLLNFEFWTKINPTAGSSMPSCTSKLMTTSSILSESWLVRQTYIQMAGSSIPSVDVGYQWLQVSNVVELQLCQLITTCKRQYFRRTVCLAQLCSEKHCYH